MKYVNFIHLLLITSNFVIAMEAERKSLASFFGVEQCCTHEDGNKNISNHCFSGKQWWYVDKEMQFCSQERDTDLPRFMGTRNKNSLSCVCFNDTDTKIIAFPWSDNNCFVCTWDRDGKCSESFDWKTFHRSFDENCEWLNKLRRSGNHPYCYCTMYSNEIEMLLNKFSPFTMLCTNKDKYFVAPFFRIHGSSIVHALESLEDEPLFSLEHCGIIKSVEFNWQGTEIITASSDCTVRLWDDTTGKELIRFVYDTPVNSAAFNSAGTEIVVGTNSGKIQILARYSTDNLEQILLKDLIDLWLQLEKPDKSIDSPEKLLEIVAKLLWCGLQELNGDWKELNCDWKDLHDVWLSFPKYMQISIWSLTHKKIQKYGK